MSSFILTNMFHHCRHIAYVITRRSKLINQFDLDKAIDCYHCNINLGISCYLCNTSCHCVEFSWFTSEEQNNELDDSNMPTVWRSVSGFYNDLCKVRIFCCQYWLFHLYIYYPNLHNLQTFFGQKFNVFQDWKAIHYQLKFI